MGVNDDSLCCEASCLYGKLFGDAIMQKLALRDNALDLDAKVRVDCGLLWL